MKERLRDLLSEVGESFDYLRSDVRNLSRYMAELEELVEVYRAFVSNTEFSTQADQVTRRKLLKKTQKVLGPPPDKPCSLCSEREHGSVLCSHGMRMLPLLMIPAGAGGEGKELSTPLQLNPVLSVVIAGLSSVISPLTEGDN